MSRAEILNSKNNLSMVWLGQRAAPKDDFSHILINVDMWGTSETSKVVSGFAGINYSRHEGQCS